jgi:hypothetical protein
VIAHEVVRRIDELAARIADTRPYDSWLTPELGVGSPESTERERRGLRGRLRGVEWKQCGERCGGHGFVGQRSSYAASADRFQGLRSRVLKHVDARRRRDVSIRP